MLSVKLARQNTSRYSISAAQLQFIRYLINFQALNPTCTVLSHVIFETSDRRFASILHTYVTVIGAISRNRVWGLERGILVSMIRGKPICESDGDCCRVWCHRAYSHYLWRVGSTAADMPTPFSTVSSLVDICTIQQHTWYTLLSKINSISRTLAVCSHSDIIITSLLPLAPPLDCNHGPNRQARVPDRRGEAAEGRSWAC